MESGNNIRLKVAIVAALTLLSGCIAPAQIFHRARPVHKDAPAPVVASSGSVQFVRQDHGCIEGPIVSIAPKAVTVRTQAGTVSLSRADLLQAGQDGALIFSARSSWADVEAVHLLPAESFRIKMHSGKLVKGSPLRVTPEGLVFKRFLWLTTRYAKSQVVTVDYLRVKPRAVGFDYFTQSAPALLFFYPQAYDQLAGLEGRIPVRLYDAVLKEDDTALVCAR